ncbi:MAG TPA: hypothetical protein VN861_07315 [Candidatus Acidoferrales bacterium]|nr:hypothetical protein [Candidatus Acidoferrales bacterium]
MSIVLKSLALLPFVAYTGLFRVFRLRGEGWRSAALGAATCWGVFVALSTELLSVPRLITRPALALAWLLLTLGSFAYAATIRAGHPSKVVNGPAPDTIRLDKLDWFLLSVTGLLVALVGLTAIISAPNTWDAMAYHMSRIVQWMTNRDVGLYPAFYSVQLFLSPWAEYAMMHLDVLYGGDRLVNLIEWFSMIGGIIGVSLIAQRLGAGIRGQIFAAIACATIPAALLEASGAMNTYVAAFWIVVAVYYFLRWNGDPTWPVTFGMGSALGLAIMTKGTAYVFLPCVLLACWWIGSAASRKLLLLRVPVLVLAILVLNGPLFVRNYRLSGSPLGFAAPLGDDTLRQYSNSRYSASVTFANVVKNLSLHVVTPIGAVNHEASRVVFASLRTLHIDPNDQADTYRGGFHLNGVSSHEERAGNPLQLALIFVSILLLFSRRIGNRALRLFALGLVGSFVLFCALVRWQAWNARYHMPLFLLGVALVGVVLERSWPRVVLTSAACLLLLAALPFVLLNSLRPLISVKSPSVFQQSRTETYFADSHRWQIHSYSNTASFVKATGCDNVGVDSSFDDFDYPMFAILGAGHGDLTVRYSEVKNLTAEYARPESGPPCAVICLRCANSPAKWAQYRQVGGRVSLFDEIAVFSSKGDLPNTQTFEMPIGYSPDQMLVELDRYRDSPPAVDLRPTEDRVIQAGHDYPGQRDDLKARLDSLYMGTVSLWRVRDSVDPLRRRGERIDHSKIDPQQLVGASEVIQNWFQTEPAKVRELNASIDRLYSTHSAQVNQ